MAIFLNTERLNYWIPKLISEAQKELVIIVPYVQISLKIFNALLLANKNGVQIIFIYRESKLTDEQRSRLLSLENLSLLYHPNVHCKTYYNGELLIIGSMNLYKYSEKNNREMGILAARMDYKFPEELDYCFVSFSDDEPVLEDAIVEIRQIMNGSQIEKASSKLKNKDFEIEIVKTLEEVEQDYCLRLNKYYLNKKFKPFEKYENQWHSKCENFFDKIDVTFEHNRIAFDFKLEKKELEKLYYKWSAKLETYEFKDFKYYWNGSDQPLLLYRDQNERWKNLKLHSNEYYDKVNEGIQAIITKYREKKKII